MCIILEECVVIGCWIGEKFNWMKGFVCFYLFEGGIFVIVGFG